MKSAMKGCEFKSDIRIKNERKTNLRGFLFALPWIIGFLCFSVYPLVTSLYYSTTMLKIRYRKSKKNEQNIKYLTS